MNYYEHHLGDYVRDTAHLSMLEDGAYRRLIDAYYIRETPLPLVPRELYRLVRAASKADREAVDTVLREFFSETAEGWQHARCEKEIARYQDGEPEREVKKANEDNRLKRHREERAALFKKLTDAGQHASWNIPMADLRALVAAIPATGVPPFPATAPATPATATQSPDPSPTPQTPEEEISHLPVAPARPSAEPAGLVLVGDQPKGPPDCPHRDVLALWAEVLPALPQHLPEQWRGTRADHLRARWRETAVLKRWTDKQHGIDYLRRLFAYVGQSAFLTGKARQTDPGKRPFVIELEWLVNPTNWAKVHEGKYHEESA